MKKIQLNEYNYNNVTNNKDKIVLLNSFTNNIDDYLEGWDEDIKTKLYLPHFYITKEGDVVDLVKPEKTTNMTNTNIDNDSIFITLENLGYLIYKNKLYVDIFGNIYNKKDVDIHNIKWRGYEYWEMYSDKQYDTLKLLVFKLLEDYKISNNVMGDNVKKDYLVNYVGVLYRSNIDEIFRDTSPTFNYEKFKKEIENV